MESRGLAESVDRPPVAPKPRAVPPPKPVLHPLASKPALNTDTSKPHKPAVKPAVAPKPSPRPAVPKPLTSNSESPAQCQEKSELQKHVGLLNSRNGPHPEHKKPEWDYVIPICVCGNEKCQECSPKENSRKPIQPEKNVEPCNNKSEGPKTPVPRTWTKPQQVADQGQVLTPPLKNSVQAFSSLFEQPKQIRIIPNQSPGAGKNAPDLPIANGIVCSDSHATKKPQSSADDGTHVPSETATASQPKVSEQTLMDNTQEIPCKTNGGVFSVRKPPPVPNNKPKNSNAMRLDKTDIISENPETTAQPRLKVVKIKESTPALSPKEITPIIPVKPPPKELKPKFVVETQSDKVYPFWKTPPLERKQDHNNGLSKDAGRKDQRLEECANQNQHSDVAETDIKVHKNQHFRSRELPDQPKPKIVSKPQKNKEPIFKEEVLQSHNRTVGSELPVSAEEKTGDKPNPKLVSLSEKQDSNNTTPEKKPTKRIKLRPKSRSFTQADLLRPQKKSSVLKILDLDLPVKMFKGKQNPYFTPVKSEKPAVNDIQASLSKNGAEIPIPEYKMHHLSVHIKETVPEPKVSFSTFFKEQSVDGDEIMAGEDDGLYEVVDTVPTSPVIQTQQQTQPHNIQKQLSNDEDDLYENVDYPEECVDHDGSNVYDIVSSDEEDIDSGSEVEEDCSSDKTHSENNSKSSKLAYIAKEIMSSEKVFVEVLKLLHITFRDAVMKASSQAGKPVIEERVFSQILSSLPQLYELNCDLLSELENRVANWNEHSGVADIFLKKGPYLKMYSSYICEFDKNVALLEEQCRKNPAFAKTVREFESSPCCANLAVKHYMLKPVQRLPQYQLLLTDYLKNLNDNSPDYKDTQDALRLVKEVASHANETMRHGDNFEKLMLVQCSLSGNHEIVQPGRVLLKQGTLMKLSRKVMQPRMFFLFNDTLLYTTPLQSGQFKLNNELSLAGMKVSKPSQEGYQNELNIESVERSFILSASSPAIRDAWLEAISNAIDNYTKKKISFISSKSPEEGDKEGSDNGAQLGSKAPIWIPDLRATMCMICTCEFTLTWRRHHCRACGKVVCQACSNNKCPLEYRKNRPARVCNQCFETLQNNSSGNQTAGNSVLSPTLKPSGGFHFRKQKKIPAALKEVSANTDESSMSGYLERTKPNKKQWKRFWCVIKNKVLYTYAASEDVAALESQPLLGFCIKDESESSLQFRLYHKNSLYYIFKADDTHIYQRWIEAFREAMIL